MQRFLFGSVFIAILVLSGAASADSYGSIAYSASKGSAGWAFDSPTQAAAEGKALKNCRQFATDCVIVTWFRNACGALAVGSGNGYGSSWADNREAAERLALKECTTHAQGCAIQRWACASEKTPAKSSATNTIRHSDGGHRVYIKHGCPSNLDRVCSKGNTGRLYNCRCVS